MRATLRDVAQRARVSTKTVSNVVHGRHARVGPATRARVLDAITTLDYRPNLAARQLRNRQAGIIALAIPWLDNPYFADLATAIMVAAAELGYTVLIDRTGGSRDQELLVTSGLRPHLIDGIIFSPLAIEADDLAPARTRLPIVLLGERLVDAPVDHVLIDNVAAGRCATAHLLAIGRCRIAAIGASTDPADAMPRLRLQGYVEALAAAGHAIDQDLIATVPATSFTREHGADGMRWLLSRPDPPDAVFCFNDRVALGAMRVLRQAGCRIPEDVAVVGVDDIEEGRYALPTLTTIAPDKAFLARATVERLVARITGQRTEPPETVYAPFRLVVRESTAAPSGRSAETEGDQ